MASEIDNDNFARAISAYARIQEGSAAVLVTNWTMVVEVIDADGSKKLRHWTSDDTPTWVVRGMMDSASGSLEYDWEEEDDA